ncbi:CRP-like cAMP-binding protein [Bradyrhizobium sp. USDA 3364]
MDPVPRSPNGFLSSLSASDFELIRPHLRTIDLAADSVLIETDEMLKRTYMPHKGVISLVVKLARGQCVQVAMVGRDSIYGAFAPLVEGPVSNNATVLVPGLASTVELEPLRAAAGQSPTLRARLIRHGLAVYAQIQQTAGCNAAHTVESRLARCLLHTRDLSGSKQDRPDAGGDGADDRRAPQQRVAGRAYPATGQFHPLQPRTHRDHQRGRTDQDRVRMLRHGEGAVCGAAELPGSRRLTVSGFLV